MSFISDLSARPWVKKAAKYIGILLGVWFFAFLCIEHNFLWLFGKMPTIEELENPPMELISELYTQDSVLMGKYYRENRVPVPYRKISPHFIKALVATEDVRFFEHGGIDWVTMVSLPWYFIKGDKRGGSTITQQLAKNMFKIRHEEKRGLLGYVPGVKTLVIKIKEWNTAIKLEQKHTKTEILRMYINTVDFGSQSFGIKTAARTFFNTTPDSLKIQEAAVLVGVLKASTTYSPIHHPDKCKERRNTVLNLLAKHQVITDAECDSLKRLPLGIKFQVDNSLEGLAPYFRLVVSSFLRKWCDENGYDLYADGLKIYTTINSKMQAYGEEAVSEHMTVLQGRFDRHWQHENPWRDENQQEIPNFLKDAIRRTDYYRQLVAKYKGNSDSINADLNRPRRMSIFTWDGELDTLMSPMDSINHYKRFLHAGLIAVDPATGFVKTWVGGINYKYFQYDHVYRSKRQPGSTFKPFVYCAALATGMSPCDKRADRPITINYEEDGEIKTWSPRNADRVYTGDTMTLRHAMARSINTITSRLTVEVTPDSVVKYAQLCGITDYLKPVPSVGLGSNDVSLYELTGSYLPFVNTGYKIRPIFIYKIYDKHGKLLAEFKPEPKRVLSEELSYLMLHMLRGGLQEPRGTSQGLFAYRGLHSGNELGGKTGTSSNQSDGWFMGVTQNLVSGVWVGADDRSVHFKTSRMGEGSKTALPIFGRFMEKVYADPSTGIEKSRFYKAPANITVPYNCTTRYPRADTTEVSEDEIPDIDEGDEENDTSEIIVPQAPALPKEQLKLDKPVQLKKQEEPTF